MTNTLISFAKCESGATAIEYSMMAVMIAISIIAILQEINVEVVNLYGSILGAFATATG